MKTTRYQDIYMCVHEARAPHALRVSRYSLIKRERVNMIEDLH